MIADVEKALLQHKPHPEPCAVHPDKPFTFSEKDFALPRGDDVFKQYADPWVHLLHENGTLAKVRVHWFD